MAKPYESIAQIKLANKAAGQHFFDPDAMRFFNSKIGGTVYMGRYFVTSEQEPGEDSPRRYTVRVAEDNGVVNTVGEFMAYETADQARHAAYDAASKAQRGES